MKFFIAFALIAAVAADVSHVLRRQSGGDADAQILRSDSDISPEGSYQFNYETSNGISAQETGSLTNGGSEGPAIAAQGSFQYTAPDGQPIQLSYVADENGFQPQGAHLPTAPPPQPIPDYIQRSLEYNAAHPEQPAPQQQQYNFRRY